MRDLYTVAHQFSPNCLRVAREFRGLQKNELARLLQVTPGAVTQFENGMIRPNAQTVGRISLVLGFPPSFFTQNNQLESISPDICHFRSLQSSSQSDRKRMTSASTLIGKIVEFINDSVNLPPEAISQSLSPGATTQEAIEEAAEKVRKDWGLGNGPISNLIALLEANGVLVFRLLDDCKKVDAFSLWHKGRPFIFLNTEKNSASRSRFDAAHELGHLILHMDYIPGNKMLEEQANRFSSAFLLPRDSFIRECPRRLIWPHLFELKQRWKVSLAALIRRARDLGLISEDSYKRGNIKIRTTEWYYNEPYEPEIEYPTIFPQALKLLCQSGWSLSSIAQHLSIPEKDFSLLVYADSKE